MEDRITTTPTPSLDASASIQYLIEQIEHVIRGKRAQIEHVVTCLIAGGHILMEDNPGTGKTVLAKTLAQCISSPSPILSPPLPGLRRGRSYGERDMESEKRENALYVTSPAGKPEGGTHAASAGGNWEKTSLGKRAGASFKRIQFTPDLLPMDLIGSHIFDDRTKDFIFKHGPLFCNVLLADEINRASPKVQSALLEAMAEHQVTVGDTTLKLEKMFFTIATQNPVEMEGTYPLPAAQLDRFFMKIVFGYVDEETEMNIYRDYVNIADNLVKLGQALSLNDILALQQQAEEVHVHEEIIKAVTHIVRDTRSHPDIVLGASTRSGISFLKCLRAYALVKGRTFVIEDDVKEIAYHVLDHRLIYRNKDGREKALDGVINKEVERLAKLKLF